MVYIYNLTLSKRKKDLTGRDFLRKIKSTTTFPSTGPNTSMKTKKKKKAKKVLVKNGIPK